MRERTLDDSVRRKIFSHYINLNETYYSTTGSDEEHSMPTTFMQFADVPHGQGEFNPCSHLTVKTDLKEATFHDYWIEGTNHVHTTRMLQYTCAFEPALAHFDLKADFAPNVSDAILSEQAAVAFNKFHDQIPEETLLANFLWELRDIKGMIPKLERSVSKTVSGNFLAYNFGIAPFIGDLKVFLSVAETVSKRLEYLKKTLGKTVDLHHDYDLVAREGFVKTMNFRGNNPDGMNVEFRQVGYKGKIHFAAKLLQNLEGLGSVLAMPKALASALGLNNPAAIIWEAIPYSFVLDWLFNLSGQLNRLAIQPFGGEWRLTDVGHSIKQEWYYVVYVDFSSIDLPANRNLPYNLGTMKATRYTRSLGLPVKSIFVTDGFNAFTPKQQMLSVALLEQLRH